MSCLKLRLEQTGKTKEKCYKDCRSLNDSSLLPNTNHNCYFVLTKWVNVAFEGMGEETMQGHRVCDAL
jgi:L-serine deaminase